MELEEIIRVLREHGEDKAADKLEELFGPTQKGSTGKAPPPPGGG